MRLMIIVLLTFTLTGCVFLDWVLGKESTTVIAEIDANGDGNLSKDEIAASKYDLNKDGILSADEMEAAMAPHKSIDATLSLLTAFGVPFVVGIAAYLKQARAGGKHIRGLVAGTEKILEKVEDGLTRDEAIEILVIAKEKYSDVKALTKAIDKAQSEMEVG